MRASDPSTWPSAVPLLYSGLLVRQCCESDGFYLAWASTVTQCWPSESSGVVGRGPRDSVWLYKKPGTCLQWFVLEAMLSVS